jgi:hypothetical protein
MVLAASSSASAAELARLAGVIDLGDGRRLAVLEFADGAQRLAQPGRAIGDIQVLEVGDEWVRLRLPEGEQRLDLSWIRPGGGTGRPAYAPEPIATRHITPVLLDGFRRFGTVPVDGPQVGHARLNELLQLPLAACVVAVDDQEVTSPEAAALALRTALENGQAPRLSVRQGEAVERIYLVPPGADGGG